MALLTCPRCSTRFESPSADRPCPNCGAVSIGDWSAAPAVRIATPRAAVPVPAAPRAPVAQAEAPSRPTVFAAPPAPRSRRAVGPLVLAAGLLGLFAVTAAATAWVVVSNRTRPTADVAAAPGTPTPPAADRGGIAPLVADLRAADPAIRVSAARRLATVKGDAQSAVPALLAALDGLSPADQLVVGSALDHVGPPAKGDLPCLVPALRSPYPAARAYALRTYAARVAAPRDAVPDLVVRLDDLSAEVRALAAEALGRAGPDAREAAFAPLVDRLGDDDPTTAAAARTALTAYGPPTDEEADVLREKLRGGRPAVRVFAAGALAGRSAGPKDAATLWGPLLRDTEPAVRAVALDTLAKWKGELGPAVPDLVVVAADRDPKVRARAVELLGPHADDPAARAVLTKALKADADPAIRDAAALGLSGSKADDLPTLRLLLGHQSDAVKVRAVEGLGRLGPEAAPAADELVALMAASPEAVQTAAVKALGALGPAAAPTAAGPLRDLLIGPRGTAAVAASTPLRREAALALARLGDPGFRALAAALKERLPPVVTGGVCEAVALTGAKANALVPEMLQLARLPYLQEYVADALVRIGSQTVIDRLIDDTQLLKVERNGKLEDKTPPEVRRWAIETLGRLDRAGLSDKQLDQVVKRLEQIRDREYVRENEAEAKKSLERLKAK